jgi:hypothetical protein
MNMHDFDGGDIGGGFQAAEEKEDVDQMPPPQQLPADLPRSLNDRRAVPDFTPETEMYDAWQGMSALSSYLILVLTPLRSVTVPNSTCSCKTARFR